MIPETAISDWLTITQDLVDRFADATGDRQWIHTDPSRGPTIAHGFLLLALLPAMLRQAAPRDDVRKSINYGLNRVRFIAPVLVGSRIRARFETVSVEEKNGASKVVWKATIENEERPCCVAEWIVVYYR